MSWDVNKLKIYFDHKKDMEDIYNIYIPNVNRGDKRIFGYGLKTVNLPPSHISSYWIIMPLTIKTNQIGELFGNFFFLKEFLNLVGNASIMLTW